MPGNHGAALTAQEERVLRLAALHHTDAEIALILGVSVRIVNAHVAHILAKLAVNSRRDASRAYIERHR